MELIIVVNVMLILILVKLVLQDFMVLLFVINVLIIATNVLKQISVMKLDVFLLIFIINLQSFAEQDVLVIAQQVVLITNKELVMHVMLVMVGKVPQINHADHVAKIVKQQLIVMEIFQENVIHVKTDMY